MSTYTPISYTATAGQTDFTISFPYLAQSHIQVYVNELLKELTTHYTIVSGTTLRFNSGLSVGDRVYIRRQTNLGTDELEVTLGIGARLKASDLNDSFKQIAYPAQEFLAEAQSEVVKTENNLSDLSSKSLARTNLGIETKSETDTKLSVLISESSNLGNLTDFDEARTNLDVYSTSEVRTQIDTAKENALEPEEGAVFCHSLEYSPIVMNCRLLLDSVNNKKIVLTSFNGNYLWCNGSVRLFYITSLTTSGLSNSTLYYVYLRCDEEGGYYLYTSTSAPTSYRNTQVQITSGEYRPLVGYIYTASNYTTNGIADVASLYNRYPRSKRIEFSPTTTGDAGELEVIYTPTDNDYIIAQPGTIVKASLLFSHTVNYHLVNQEQGAGDTRWDNYLQIQSKNTTIGGILESKIWPSYSTSADQGHHLFTKSVAANTLDLVSCRWYIKVPAQVAIYDEPEGAEPWSSSTTYNPGEKVYRNYNYFVAINENKDDKPPSGNWLPTTASFKEYRDPDLTLDGYLGLSTAYILLSVQ